MTLRIAADTLIPGRGEPIADGAVILDGDTIVYAGPAAGAPPAAAEDSVARVPAAMPGMWEAHGHFVGSPIPDLEHMATADPVSQIARATADLAATLDAGVTSVREVGGIGLSLKPAA